MPTRYRRIAVTADPELEQALDAVEPYFPGRPAAAVVHELVLKGSAAVLEQRAAEAEAIERLIEWSTSRDDSLDWELLERIEDEAWG